MDNKKKIIIAVAVVVIVAIIAGIAVSVDVNNNNNNSSIVNNVGNENTNGKGKPENKSEDAENEVSGEQEKVTPTFMYFVSKSDADYDAAMKAVESLKKSYGKKVKFDIVDVDENPQTKENFPLVDGQTPTLIMLNTSNDISNIKFKCSDEAELKSVIDAALE